MSARRRARSAGFVRTAEGVPSPLTDPDHELWMDREAVEALADACDIDYVEPGRSLMRDPYFERFRAFRRAYAQAYGFMSDRWDRTLDHRRLAEAGIFAGGRGPRWRMLPDGSVERARGRLD